MVRLRQSTSESEGNDNVVLYLVGPKFIIPKSVAVETRLSNTWFQVFNDQLNLGVTDDQELFVCCTGYCPTAPKDGEGWRAELHEPIKDFIDKYERKRKQYRVRICFPCDSNGNQVNNGHIGPRTPRKRASTPAASMTPNGRRGRSAARSASPVRRPNIVISTDRGSTSVLPSTSNGVQSSSNGQDNQSHLTRAQRHALRISRENLEGSNGHLNGTRQLAKRSRTQSYTEVRIQTDIPSVPGPHVFVNEENFNSSQTLRIDNYRSVVKSECISEYYEELEADIDDDYAFGDGEEGEREDIEEEEEEENGEEEIQDEHGQIEEEEDDEFGRMSDEEDNAGDNGDNLDNVEDRELAKELRELGIPFEDIRSHADRKCTGFSNAYLLRIRSEMDSLNKNNKWVDVFQRAPLAFYFLQELFRK